MSTKLSFIRRACLGCLIAVASCLAPLAGQAQEQQQGLCAQIKIVINQKLTLERVGFQATLEITDNDGNDPITDFAANLTFENPLLSTNGTVNDASPLFFVKAPTLQNIQSVNGSGTIGPAQTASVGWFLIPTVTAGGTSPEGTRYKIGAKLSGKIRGVEIPQSALLVLPATITVKPDAQLEITYFTPRDVTADNPFTPEVEAPVPFTFGVLVKNTGYGPAHNVMIESQQPKITENVQNLLIVAQLLGTRVNDSALANANLTVNLGDLQPGQATKGAWDMITTLSGTFLSVNASYTHSSDLGGSETSLIKSLNAYLFLHEVLNDQPGRDHVHDFLADTAGTLDAIGNLVPDSIYESEGNIVPVNTLSNAIVVGSGNPFQVTLTPTFDGWGFMRLSDPGQAKFPIGSVVRSDGKVLNTNNFWTNIHYEPGSNFKDTYLNILDFVSLGASYTYTVTYTNVPVDTTPPVTTLNFAGPSTFSGGAYYITPDTQMYFLSQDASPVSIVYSITNSPFLPALPFSLTVPGTYPIQYHATDANNNQESNHSATLVVAGAGSVGFASANVPGQPLFDPGAAVSVRPAKIPVSFQASPNPTPLNAQVDIFQGVVAWPTVGNVPSSPTSSTSAALAVSGMNVDFYIYQLNGGAWSLEQPVASPLNLSSLPTGTNVVALLGRSQYGGYLDASNALSVYWVVDPAAPATRVTGVPISPTSSTSAQLTVSGTGVTNYRWTISDGFYRAPSNVVSQIIFSNLNLRDAVVAVIGQVGGVYQPTNTPTVVRWTIDPLYGYDLSALPAVRHVAFTNIGNGVITYNWDGRSDANLVEPPGLYTVRITLSDPLGNTNFTTRLAQIGTLSGTNIVLADFVRGPKNPYSRGRWSVWEDQSDGNWEVYAQNSLLPVVSNAPTRKVTSTPFSQENPKTDGHYAVWQSRQPNGNWDVFYKDLTSNTSPQAVTSTTTLDEINPAIDWPWVVCQVRPTGSNSAPWNLTAYNLATAQSFVVSPSTQDELDPEVQAGRVVWQDFRDVGAGEIYYASLELGGTRRITTNNFGQYHPAIFDNWIVWEDNRNVELDIYGFDLLRNREVRITSTPEDETRPHLEGPWLACLENSLGAQTGNVRLIHLPSLVAVPVTRTATTKNFPAIAEGLASWQETVANQSRITAVTLPSLQPVFQNQNIVAVSDAMVTYAQNAYGLLSLWGSNGVQQITRYTSLAPQVTSQTAVLSNGVPSGPNFSLVSGSFLWVRFNTKQVLDLGLNNSAPLNLAAGANVFGYTGFPDSYSAYQLLRQIGLNNATSVRMLDAESGRWLVAEVEKGGVVGNDFPIPNVAVIMINLTSPVSQFVPQTQ